MSESKKPRILLIEDDAMCRQLQQDALELAGLEAVSTESAIQAFKVLNSESVDIVVLDLSLPNISGIEVLRRMRSEGYNQPVMFCSASSHRQDVAKAVEMGAVDYLLKPFSIKIFIDRIKSVVAKSQEVPLPKDDAKPSGNDSVSKGFEKFGDYFLGLSEESPSDASH